MNHSEIYEHPNKKHHEWSVQCPLPKQLWGCMKRNSITEQTQLPSGKLTWAEKWTVWICISYWKWGFSNWNVRFTEGQNCTQLIQDSSARLRWSAAKIDSCGIHLCWGFSVIHGKQNHPTLRSLQKRMEELWIVKRCFLLQSFLLFDFCQKNTVGLFPRGKKDSQAQVPFYGLGRCSLT